MDCNLSIVAPSALRFLRAVATALPRGPVDMVSVARVHPKVDALSSGVLAGLELTDVHASVQDGSYHEEDSTADAFREAAAKATTKALRDAHPVILEALASVSITVPKEFIFPDKTFVYCEWADVMSNTVFDKGTWSLSGDILELKSVSEVTWEPHLERRFLAVRRHSQSREILLVGIDRELQYFEEKAGDDPELMLLIVGRQRDRTINQAETPKIKAKLMREGWRPEFFRD
jgi:hypothetical protein